MFQVYKGKQGVIIRWSAFITCAILFLFGAYQLFHTIYSFRDSNWKWLAWLSGKVWYSFVIPLVSIDVHLSPRLLIASGTAIFFLLFFRYLCFKNERISDFLIDTESEMRKVNWPKWNEVFKSSIAVMVIVVILGLYLYGVDLLFSWFFSKIFSI